MVVVYAYLYRCVHRSNKWYSDHSKGGGEPVDITDSFLPNPEHLHGLRSHQNQPQMLKLL